MHYIDLVREAPLKSEDIMWQSVAAISSLIDRLWQSHQPIARQFMLQEYERLYGPHFNEELARATVSEMYHSTDPGKMVRGEIVTPEEAATINPAQPWDAYVAANAFAHDLAPLNMSRRDLLQAAKAFWFHDEDFPSDTKIFWYVKNK